jgi:hypothetical protein
LTWQTSVSYPLEIVTPEPEFCGKVGYKIPKGKGGVVVKIVWEQSIYIGNAPVFCTICGRRSYPIRGRRNQLLLAVIYDQQGVMHGEACKDCVASGSEGIKARLQERVQGFQAKISELEHLASEAIDPPTLEEEFQFHRQDAS